MWTGDARDTRPDSDVLVDVTLRRSNRQGRYRRGDMSTEWEDSCSWAGADYHRRRPPETTVTTVLTLATPPRCGRHAIKGVMTAVSLALALSSASAQDHKRVHSPTEVARAVHVIRTCLQAKWNISEVRSPDGGLVKIRLKFNRNGTLASKPEVISPKTSPEFVAMAQSAVRAAVACQPYPFSPDSYDVWKDVILTFDAQDMLTNAPR